MSNRPGQQAIVVGGSIAGLDRGARVVRLFRAGSGPRRDEVATGQSFTNPFRRAITSMRCCTEVYRFSSLLYPAFTEDLTQRGATQIKVGRDIVWYLPDGKAYKRYRFGESTV